MKRENVESILPLSPSQQGIFLETLAASAPELHVEQSVAIVRGRLDTACLERAWQAVIDCHSMLRTGFVGKELAKPVQVVYRRVDAPLRVLDWREIPAAERQADLEEYLRRDRRAGFELRAAPLMRLAAIRTGDEEHALVWTHHHILMDGWCISLVLGDLFASYRAATEGRPPALRPSRPYRDFVRWIQAQDLGRAQAFWQERLRGFRRPTALGVPAESSLRAGSPSEACSAGEASHAEHTARLPKERLEALRGFARQHRLTLATLVQGAWAALLGRYGGSPDVLFGVTVSGRPPELEGVESTIGLFMTTLPLRVRIDGDRATVSWLEDLQRQQQDQQAYAYCGGGQVHGWSDVPGSWPLYESIVVFENYPVDRAAIAASGLSIDLEGARTIGARTRNALALLATPGEGLELHLVYDRARFRAADMERLARHLDALLGRFVAEPASAVSRLMAVIPPEQIPHVAQAPWEVGQQGDATTEQSLEAQPRSPIEQRVASVWAEVLDRPAIGRRESFFQLGGHSLLATQVIARLGEAFGRKLPLRLLFDHPTIADLAAAIERTSDSRDARLPPPLTVVPRNERIPLSFNQQRLWFLDRLGEESATAYCEQGAVRLVGRLDTEALERSLRELIERHEPLRTTFVEIDGQPAQVIDPAAVAALGRVDLSRLDGEERLLALQRLTAEEAARPFDLSKGPLLRLTLYRFGPLEHVLALTIHHIITDGWSHAIFFEELTLLYRAFAAGLPSPLRPLTLQYADYAAWQQRWLQGPVLEAEFDHWLRRLEGAPARSSLPTDRPRRPTQGSGRGALISLALPRERRDGLHALAHREGATLFMVVLAALELLLYRYTGQDDLLVGTPVAGRSSSELERVFGFFVNTLVLRTDLSGEPTFSQLLGRVREAALAAYAHQDVPFEKLVERLRPDRSLAHNPLFQVFVNMLNHPPVALQLEELRVEEVKLPRTTSMFDFTLYIADVDAGLRLDLVYRADLFAEERMRALLVHLDRLLAQVAERPHEPIASYPLRAAADTTALPDPTSPLSTHAEVPVHATFATQAQRTPRRLALVGREGAFTFAELEAHANRLAHHLGQRGVRAGDVVAVYGHRSAALVWAMLGVLKAGAAFTLFDPAHPAERLVTCLRMARPSAFIALQAAGAVQPALASAISALPCCIVLPSLADAAESALLQGQPDTAPSVTLSPDDPAYVAFTSGTTGAPKGILGTHRPIAHFLAWYARTFQLGEAERFAMLSGLSHDPLLRDVFAPLCLGATLHIPDASDLDSAERLVRWLARSEVSVLHLTPALGQFLTAAEGSGLDAGVLTALRRVLFGGAVLTEGLVHKLRQIAPGTSFVNTYGATETPQIIAYHIVASAERGHEAPGTGGVVPIGRGIDDVQLLIINPAGQMTDRYEVGEICVRTPYLAKGYVEHVGPGGFDVNPFSGRSDDRIYRTGDLGYYLADGSVMLLGRRDRQIKVRGYRVELAEIEHHLLAHPNVEQAAVVARAEGEDSADMVPIAYLVGGRAEPERLRVFLEERLPLFMVPAAFVRLDALPRTPNGKLDERALPVARTRGEAALAAGPVAPRDDIERTLCALFREVLGLREVGIRDDFFSIGGHSLKAIQLVSRVRRALGVEVPLRALFTLRTVEALGAEVRRTAPAAALPPISRAAPAEHYPLSHAQRRLWVLDQLDASGAAYTMNDALLLEGELDSEAMNAAFGAICQRHESLRTVFVEIEGEPRQKVLVEIAFRCAAVDLRAEPDPRAAARALADAEARRRFDLARGPMLRVTLLRLADREHVLLFSMHHIVSDAWSIGVLVRELLDAYERARSGRAPDLPPLGLQYRDYTAWQARLLASAAIQPHRDYWHRRLGGPLEPLNLPTDFPRPPVKTYRGAVLDVRLDGRARALRELGDRQGASLFMTLVALVKVLLHRYTGQEDIAVGSPVAGRDRMELEEQIGCYVNMLVLRDHLEADQPFEALLDRVRRTATEAYEHQVYPFDLLVDELRASREMSRSPLFDVAVVLQQGDKADKPAPSLKGLCVTPFEQRAGASKFDLRFVFEQAGDDLLLALEYSEDLFREGRVRRMAGHLSTLIASALREPGRAIGALDILPQDERRQLLETFNATDAGYPRGSTIVDLFEAQAAASPEAIAVVFEGKTLTYAELNRQSNQLASRLRHQHGVAPNDLVAVVLDRSEQMIIALLATLKAGGAYVPIDPEYPHERIRHMLTASRCRLVLTEARHRAILEACLPPCTAEGERPAMLDVHVDRDAEAGNNLGRIAGADDAAYVIFTSGSTGNPKGCTVTHRNVVRLLKNDRFPFDFGPDDVWVTAHSFCFDFTVWEMYGALLWGGRVVVVRREQVRDVTAFHALIRAHRVTVLNQTPAAFYGLIEVERSRDVHDLDRHLRTVIFGGDRLEPAYLAPWASLYPPGRIQLVNMFGITETTVHVTHGVLTKEEVFGATGRSPIGVPLPETRVYVCDANMEPQPIGVAGELYVGGSGVCRGYLGEPELTAQRFVPDPFAPKAGPRPGEDTRLYRSGDIGRWNEDGTLEHLGRNDAQVQLRGYRVELGEVEAALLRHESVRKAAVLAREVSNPSTGPGMGDLRLFAYVVPEGQGRVDPGALRAFLEQRLPGYMIPAEFVALPALPLTSNGKVDRRALLSMELGSLRAEPAAPPERSAPPAERGAVQPSEEVIREIWQGVLGVERVGINDNFFEIGGHSLLLFRVRHRIEQRLQRSVEIVDLFRYPTVRALAAFLAPQVESAPTPTVAVDRAPLIDHSIAIIGMSGRFPGAPDIDIFWRNLCGGVESVHFFTDEELAAAGIDPAVYRDPSYVKARPVLADADKFDADFFGMTPREAEITDPQHRLFLETAWQALEDAGYAPDTYPGRIGVFAGSSASSYLIGNILPNRDRLQAMGDYPLLIGNDKDYLATRVSYKLDLRGPSVTVGTACSTSLVAVDWACQSLRDGKADMALAGGVSIKTPQTEGYAYQRGGILSPDGHCRAFDAGASGTIGGSGVAAVVLKPLQKAIADGDHIYAVIKGSATNNDGAGKVGFTAPSVEGQANVIAAALADAGVEPETIGYVEAHGTGTPLGDPVEIAALTQAFRSGAKGTNGVSDANGVNGTHEPLSRAGTCAVGSVKTNIGHLDAAAGVTGLIKAALALDHKQIPPTVHFERPNPEIDFASSPFFVAAALAEWKPSGSTPRRAGVSSFGIGGTNAHVVLEEAPAPPEPRSSEQAPQVLILSAKTRSALEARAADLSAHLRAHPDLALADVAYSLQVGRAALSRRRAFVCRDHAEAIERLVAHEHASVFEAVAGERGKRVAFLLPGQGAQHVGMGRDLYAREPVFREIVDECCAILRAHMDVDLRAVLYPEEEGGRALLTPIADRGTREAAEALLAQTAVAQPALFVVEYALARLWQRWGVRADAMLGHSLGEYVAACLCGVLDLEQALLLVATRGRMMQELPGGAMLAVSMAEEQIAGLLGTELDLAAVNGPSQCVVSGEEQAIASLEAQLRERGILCRRLRTAHTFHSRRMEPILGPFAAVVARLDLRPPRERYISNVTGTWITEAEATDPAYYARHLRATVRFEDGLSCLLEDPERVLLEVGPGRTLTSLVKRRARSAQSAGEEPRVEHTALTTLPAPEDSAADHQHIRETLGRLWLNGVDIDWAALHGAERRRRVSLPGYPFERKSYWLSPPGARVASAAASTETARSLEKKLDVAEWFYVPSWRRAAAPLRRAGGSGAALALSGREQGPSALRDEPAETWLVFLDERGLGEALARQLAGRAHTVYAIQRGPAFRRVDERTFSVNPAEPSDHHQMVHALRPLLVGSSLRIAHLWSVTLANGYSGAASARDDDALNRGYFSLLFLAQALSAAGLDRDVHLTAVANGLVDVTGETAVSPDKATLLGPMRVIPQERPGISCRVVDVLLPEEAGDASAKGSAQALEELAARLSAELQAPSVERLVAYRGPHRWIHGYESLRLDLTSPGRVLRPGGVYLITGGIGGIGLLLAEYLARAAKARLVLVGRSALPPASEWDAWLAEAACEPGDAVADAFFARLEAEGRAARTLLAAEADSIDKAEARLAAELGLPDAPPDLLLKRRLDALCAAYIYAYFTRSGIDMAQGRICRIDEVRELLRILPPFEKFYRFFLRVLAEDGLIGLRGDEIAFLVDPHAVAAPEEQARAIQQDHPELTGEFDLLEHCVRHYGPALSGEITSLSVLYPEGRPDLLERNARETAEPLPTRLYMRLLTDLILKRIHVARGERRFRILEVGAGSGLLTRMLAPLLRDRNVEYVVTDLGRSLVRRAEREAQQNGFDFMAFRTFDISKDPAAQGIEPFDFDIVIGLNVVHATRSIAETLANLRSVLVPGGVLALVETVKSERWTEMVWGLTEGWWYFEDTDLRPDSPLMDLDRWVRAARDQGFAEVISFPRRPNRRSTSECGLLLAQQPEALDVDPRLGDAYRSRQRAQRAEARRHIGQRIAKLREMQALGAEVMTVTADVADRARMAEVVAEARRRFGAIHGVVHAAGETAEDSISLPLEATGRRSSLRQLHARALGLRALDEALREESPDFALAISSNAAVLGGLGLSAYAAACNFLDAYPSQPSTARHLPWLSANWDRWPTARVVEQFAETRTSIDRYAMTQDECEDAFTRLLGSGVTGQVVVSAGDLAPRLRRWIHLESAAPAVAAAVSDGRPTPAPRGAGRPLNDIEKGLAELWRDLIGVENISAHDNFFELGGDSLLGTRLITRAGVAFDVELPMQSLFERPTIAELAQCVVELKEVRRRLQTPPSARLGEQEEEGEI